MTCGEVENIVFGDNDDGNETAKKAADGEAHQRLQHYGTASSDGQACDDVPSSRERGEEGNSSFGPPSHSSSSESDNSDSYEVSNMTTTTTTSTLPSTPFSFPTTPLREIRHPLILASARCKGLGIGKWYGKLSRSLAAAPPRIKLAGPG